MIATATIFTAVLLVCTRVSWADPCPPAQVGVMPPDSVYVHVVPIKKIWLSTDFYTGELSDYPPGGAQETCAKEYDNLDVFLSDYEGKLAAKRRLIEDEMRAGREPFLQGVDAVHRIYSLNYEHCVAAAGGQQDRGGKVVAYDAELARKRSAAGGNFDRAVDDAMATVKGVTDGIVARFRTCLETRSSQIASYGTKVDEAADAAIKNYEKYTNDFVGKRIDWVKEIFQKLYEGKGDGYKEAMEKYECDLIIQLAVLQGDYASKVRTAATAMKDCFRCGYICRVATGCCDVTTDCSTKTLPDMPEYKFKFSSFLPFAVDWKEFEFDDLKKLSTEERACQLGGVEKYYKGKIELKYCEYLKLVSSKVGIWKDQIAEWKKSAQTGLAARIESCIPSSYCRYPIYRDSLYRQLQCQAKRWMAQHESQLAAQVSQVDCRTRDCIMAWRAAALAQADQVVAGFKQMTADRDAKVVAYAETLRSERATKRIEFETSLNQLAEEHKAAFETFYADTFGDLPVEDTFVRLRSSYKDQCVEQRRREALDKFDACWNKWTPQLIEHYTAAFNCADQLLVPELSDLGCSWRFCPPSVDQCQFYF